MFESSELRNSEFRMNLRSFDTAQSVFMFGQLHSDAIDLAVARTTGQELSAKQSATQNPAGKI